jgi:hypothetical protein
MPSVTTDTVIDRLYGLPPEEFVSARDLAVRDLRAGGQRAEAARVKELRKPTAGAAAVNRLVRDHRADVKRFLAAAEALQKAQLSGRNVKKATRRERQALERLVRGGGDQVRQSLQAAAADREAARQLLEARLEHELEPRGFGTLLDHALKELGQARKVPTRPATKKPDDRLARAELDRARRALADVQDREREAEQAWKRVKADVRKAEQAVANAERDLANFSS